MLVAGLVLSACTVNAPWTLDLQQRDARAEWMTVAAHEAWVNLPHTPLVLERQTQGVTEQRVLLPNATSLPGENFVYLSAQQPTFFVSGGRQQLQQVLAQVGGLPSPFTKEELQALRSREDSAGTLNWAEWTSGAGTTCALALRRLDHGNRMMPDGAIAIDMVMRNCVRGTIEQALAPAGPDMMALTAQNGRAQGEQARTLSPLAGPLP